MTLANTVAFTFGKGISTISSSSASSPSPRVVITNVDNLAISTGTSNVSPSLLTCMSANNSSNCGLYCGPVGSDREGEIRIVEKIERTPRLTPSASKHMKKQHEKKALPVQRLNSRPPTSKP
ncbi:hypothetical protein ACHAXS_002860 [Conticribra weissflogii]